MVVALIFSFAISDSYARSLTASLANIPVHSEMIDGEAQGRFVDVIRLLDKAYTDGDIHFQIYPFARSIANVQNHQADFHLPLIRPVNKNAQNTEFYYVEEPICQVTFVLYSLKSNNALTSLNAHDFKIDTHRGHQNMFTFDSGEVSSVSMGIKKLLSGRIDGFIFEQEAVDRYIKENKITFLKRQLYATFDSAIIVPKSEKGKDTARKLSLLLRKLKHSNELTNITQTIHQPFQEWQP